MPAKWFPPPPNQPPSIIGRITPLTDAPPPGPTFDPLRATAVGDLSSEKQGTGARDNAGKLPAELLPYTAVAKLLPFGMPGRIDSVRDALFALGDFQAGNDDALRDLMFATATAAGLSIDELIAEAARVYAYGRQKYAIRRPCTCHVAMELGVKGQPPSGVASAETVETRPFDSVTQNTRSASEPTEGSGTQGTRNECNRSSTRDRGEIAQTQTGSGETSTHAFASSMGLNQSNTMHSSRQDARFADRTTGQESITVTEREERAQSSATLATSALDLSKGLMAGLAKHAPTCGVHEIVKTGTWNWAKGMPYSVAMACVYRHLMGDTGKPGMWHDPKGKDAESGLLHAGHVACNVLMLSQWLLTYRAGDDRSEHLRRPPF